MWIAATFYIVVLILAVIRPFWGLVGLIASLLIRFQDRFSAIESLPTFQLTAIALIIGMFLHSDQVAEPKLTQDRLIAYFAGFVFVGLIAMEPSETIEQVIGLMSSIIIYYFVTRLVTNQKQLMVLLVSLSIVTLGLGLEALYSYYLDSASPFANPITGRLQGIGYYANANEFGKLMTTAIPFVGIFLFRGGAQTRLIAAGTIAVMVLVVGATLSRTCFVSLAVTIAAAIMFRGKGRLFRKAIVTLVAGIFLLVSLTYVPGPLQERAQSILEYSTDKSFQGRVRAWDQGFLMISWYPVFGVGKGQWMEYHGRAPHNSYVQVLAETGIPGFILFMSVIWVSLRSLASYLQRGIEERSPYLSGLGLAIAASFSGYLFYILLGNQGYSPWTYFYFGLCGAFSHLSQMDSNGADDSGTERRFSKPVPHVAGTV